MCLWRLAFALCALVRLAINVAPPMAAAAAKLALVPVLEEAAGVAGAGLAVLPRWGCNWRAAPEAYHDYHGISARGWDMLGHVGTWHPAWVRRIAALTRSDTLHVPAV